MTDVVTMGEILRMAEAAPVVYGVVKITWLDGHQGVVDLRPVISEGAVFEFLRTDHRRFYDLQIDEHGHRLYWLDDDGDEIDLGTDALRLRSDRQDELHRLVG